MMGVFRLFSSNKICFILIFILTFLVNSDVYSKSCTATPVPGNKSQYGSMVSVSLDGRRLLIPMRFLSWTDRSAESLCGLSGTSIYTQFWYPSLQPTPKEFWYRDEIFVKGWKISPQERFVIKAQSIETLQVAAPKFNSARRRIDNALANTAGKGTWIGDGSSLLRFHANPEGPAIQNWMKQSNVTDIFVSCSTSGGLSLCIGFIDFKELGLSVRFRVPKDAIAIADKVTDAIRARLRSWIEE